MTMTVLDRRTFMRRALEATAVVAVSAGGAVTIAASNQAWAMALGNIDEHGAAVLLKMTRLLYPHDALADIYYAACVENLDAKAGADPALYELLKTGIADLDKVTAVPFLELSDGYQIDALTRMQATPFFQAVRGHTIVALYNNPNVWPFFGYQGSSFEYGGYLQRGFQDAGWMGTPPADASPEPYLG